MNNDGLARIINLAAKDSKRGARVVAKAFYRILRKNGFTENQIIEIATNILDCLTISLNGYQKKVEKIKEETTPAKENSKFRRKSGFYQEQQQVL